ncbi:MAG: hypothetical protein WKG32_04670 [Gemmatimonadaceae bacterium]
MPRKRRSAVLAICALALAAAPRAAAQILEGAAKRPTVRAYVSAGIGYSDLQSVSDPGSGSVWVFSPGAQYRASLEIPAGRGLDVGVSGTWARMPLGYATGLGDNESVACCLDAHATVSTLMATVHSGASARRGFYSVLDIGVGILRFANFSADDGGDALPPRSNMDFIFGIGGGAGYAFSSTLSATVVQDVGLSLHERGDLSNEVRTSVRHQTTRLGVRYGFATRTRRSSR